MVAALGGLGVEEVAFPADTARALSRLRVVTGLKLPDCCVLLTALDYAGTVASFDARLVRAAAEQNLPVRAIG